MATRWRHLKDNWEVFTCYQRFESMVALALAVFVALFIAVALFPLAESVIAGLLLGVLDPLDQEVFHHVFGNIMTLIIALEFNHTLHYAVVREQSIVQVKVVLLIALLALARKFIILDLEKVSAGQLAGLAAVTLVLGATYWLLRERDERATSVP